MWGNSDKAFNTVNKVKSQKSNIIDDKEENKNQS